MAPGWSLLRPQAEVEGCEDGERGVEVRARMRCWRWRWAAAFLLVVTVACAARTVHHRVRPGETLYRIGKAYGVPYQQIARENGLSDPSRIRVGQRLRIPGASKAVPVDLITPREVGVGDALPVARTVGMPEFRWPVAGGVVTGEFGKRGDGFHDGIDIAAPAGAPVRAAADGEVAYSATLAAYGNVIILRHAQGFATVYAHNERNHVREGERVRRGQVIATVGQSGRTSAAHLHFEVRKDNVARNPVSYVPRAEQAERGGSGLGGG